MTTRTVREADFRMPEFRDANPEDYEFRSDGKLVRKDRWERAVNTVRHLVGVDSREFEISEVLDAVRKLAADQEGWLDLTDVDEHYYPEDGSKVSIRLMDGSVLRQAIYAKLPVTWTWRGVVFSVEDVHEWRDELEDKTLGTS